MFKFNYYYWKFRKENSEIDNQYYQVAHESLEENTIKNDFKVNDQVAQKSIGKKTTNNVPTNDQIAQKFIGAKTKNTFPANDQKAEKFIGENNKNNDKNILNNDKIL